MVLVNTIQIVLEKLFSTKQPKSASPLLYWLHSKPVKVKGNQTRLVIFQQFASQSFSEDPGFC